MGELSGGEQARVLIARLILRPADVLILDEPTNDLDIPTLEVLEESLEEFAGALVLVTHDRYMLRAAEYRPARPGRPGRGGAVRRRRAVGAGRGVRARRAEAQGRGEAARPGQIRPAARPSALTYMEQREWEQIEANIQQAEEQVEAIKHEMGDPQVLADHQRLAAVCRRMESAQADVVRLYARWEELEAKQTSYSARYHRRRIITCLPPDTPPAAGVAPAGRRPRGSAASGQRGVRRRTAWSHAAGRWPQRRWPR